MFPRSIITIAILCTLLFASSCGNDDATQQATNTENIKIVSLNGTVSEILCALGLEDKIVGVDVSSVYPESLNQLPKMGHSHSYNIESIIALNPQYVIGLKQRGLKPEQEEQLKQAGIKVWNFNQEFSIDGTKHLISTLADSFQKQDKAKEIITSIDKSLEEVKVPENKPKVLFIYARGAGALQVAGDNTQFAAIIKLAGGVPATDGEFENFKPLTAEAVVAANPDYILLFNDGLASIDGPEGLIKVPGIATTNAGKNNKFIAMDGLKLSGFGPRVGEAVKELSEKLND